MGIYDAIVVLYAAEAVPGAQRKAQLEAARDMEVGRGSASARGRGTVGLGRSAAASRKRPADANSEPALPVSSVAARPDRAAVKHQPPKKLKQQQKNKNAQQKGPKGGKQQQAVVREGLRHTKQNYEKLAGVRHTRSSKAASKKRLLLPVRQVSLKVKALPKPKPNVAEPPSKPPKSAREPAKPTAKPAMPAQKQADSSMAGKDEKDDAGHKVKATKEKAAAVKERKSEDAAPRAKPAQKAAAKAVKVAVLRGRDSRNAGHLRQGSTQRPPAGMASIDTICNMLRSMCAFILESLLWDMPIGSLYFICMLVNTRHFAM